MTQAGAREGARETPNIANLRRVSLRRVLAGDRVERQIGPDACLGRLYTEDKPSMTATQRRQRRVKRATLAAVLAALVVHVSLVASVDAFGLGFVGRRFDPTVQPPREPEDVVDLETTCAGDAALAATARTALCLAPWRKGDLETCTNDVQMNLWMDLSSCQAENTPSAAVSMLEPKQAEKLTAIDPEPLLDELKKQEQQPPPPPPVQPQQQQQPPPPPPPPPAPARPAQVVETAKPTHEKPPENTRLLSEYDITRREAEGRARLGAGADGREEQAGRPDAEGASEGGVGRKHGGSRPRQGASRHPTCRARCRCARRARRRRREVAAGCRRRAARRAARRDRSRSTAIVPRRGDGALEQQRHDRSELPHGPERRRRRRARRAEPQAVAGRARARARRRQRRSPRRRRQRRRDGAQRQALGLRELLQPAEAPGRAELGSGRPCGGASIRPARSTASRRASPRCASACRRTATLAKIVVTAPVGRQRARRRGGARVPRGGAVPEPAEGPGREGRPDHVRVLVLFRDRWRAHVVARDPMACDVVRCIGRAARAGARGRCRARDPRDDAFPLSTYPMFAEPRPTTLTMDYALGETAAGERRTLSPRLVGTGEVLQAYARFERAVARAGPARPRCAARSRRASRGRPTIARWSGADRHRHARRRRLPRAPSGSGARRERARCQVPR